MTQACRPALHLALSVLAAEEKGNTEVCLKTWLDIVPRAAKEVGQEGQLVLLLMNCSCRSNRFLKMCCWLGLFVVGKCQLRLSGDLSLCCALRQRPHVSTESYKESYALTIEGFPPFLRHVLYVRHIAVNLGNVYHFICTTIQHG